MVTFFPAIKELSTYRGMPRVGMDYVLPEEGGKVTVFVYSNPSESLNPTLTSVDLEMISGEKCKGFYPTDDVESFYCILFEKMNHGKTAAIMGENFGCKYTFNYL